MRITLHIGALTVTIIVKKRENRHSAKGRFSEHIKKIFI